MKLVSRRIGARLAASVLLINLFIYLLAGTALYQSHQRDEEAAALSAQNLAHSLSITVKSVLDKLDVGLSTVALEAERELRRGNLDDTMLSTMLTQQKSQLQDFEDMWISDDKGAIRWGTQLPEGLPINIQDREYFIRLQNDPKLGIVISSPVMGRITKAWSILVARRINHADNSFAGVVLGSLRVADYFQHMFAPLALGDHGVVALRGEDMSLYARYAAGESVQTQMIGSKQTSSAAQEMLQKSADAGTYIAKSAIDQIKRVFFTKRFHLIPSTSSSRWATMNI